MKKDSILKTSAAKALACAGLAAIAFALTAEEPRWKSQATSAPLTIQSAVKTELVSTAIPLRTARSGLCLILR